MPIKQGNFCYECERRLLDGYGDKTLRAWPKGERCSGCNMPPDSCTCDPVDAPERKAA